MKPRSLPTSGIFSRPGVGAAILFALSLSAGISAPAAANDLMTVYKEALASDAVYSSARYSLAAGQEKYPQGLATLLPTIGATLTTQANYANIASRAAGVAPVDRFFNTNGYTLTLSQPLFRWQNWQTYEQGKLQVAQAEIGRAHVLNSSHEFVSRMPSSA